METLWETNKINKFSALDSPKDYDIAIVGGGLTALLTAYFLKDSPLKIGVICDKNFSQSASARSNAKITTVNTTLYSDIAKYFGSRKAEFFYDDKYNAMLSYLKIIKDHNIECNLETASSFLYATTKQGEEKIKNELDFFRKAKIPCVNHNDTLENLIEITSAYEFTNEHSFNPVKFMEELISIMKEYKNIDFFDNSPVTKIKNSYLIANTQKVTFNHCVVATHFPPFRILGQYPLKMYQEKATIATFTTSTPLKNMYVGVDDDSISYRPLNGNTMILVANNHHVGEESLQTLDLFNYAKKHFKDVDNFKIYSNQDCVTFDGLPFVDAACFLLPKVYIATGFNLFGITSSMLSAKHISRRLLDGTKLPKLYSRNRFNYSAQKTKLKKHIGKVVYELFHRYNFKDGVSHQTINELEEGDGFTFLYKGRNLGVSKQDGKLIFVVNKCPHLGCPLHYNKESKTWDCRCHGSSYKATGKYIFSPTNKNLEIFDYSSYKIKHDNKEI